MGKHIDEVNSLMYQWIETGNIPEELSLMPLQPVVTDLYKPD
jgi:hypothetical protein